MRSHLRTLVVASFMVINTLSWTVMASEGTKDDLPQNVVVITSDELRQGLYGYDLFDILSVLRTKTGIAVKSSSDVGAEDWVLIRGLPRDSSRNVLVLIDGMPLNDSFVEANEIEHIPPVELIEKIVVYKPPLPARFGGYTAVIEIFTRKSSEAHKTELSGGMGEYGSRIMSFSTESSYRALWYHLSLDYLETDNLTGVRRTPPKEDVVYGDRSYWKVRPAFKLVYGLSDSSELSLYMQYVKSEKFFSDEIFRGEKEFRERELLNFNLGYLWSPVEDSDLLLSLFRTEEVYRLNLKMHPTTREQNRYKQGIRLKYTLPAYGRHRLSVGGEYTNLYVEEELGSPLELNRVSFYGLYIEDHLGINERTSLTLGMRFDDHSEADSAWNPYVSVVYMPSGSTSLYGIWGRTTRWPGLNEFSNKNQELGLEGEGVESFELGVRQTIGEALSTQFAVFQVELEKESELFMDFSTFPLVVYQRNASDKIRSRGVEAEVNFEIAENLRGFLNYTYNEVKRKPDDTYVDYGPPTNLVNAGLLYSRGKGSLNGVVSYASGAKGVQRMGGKSTTLDEWVVVDIAGNLDVTNNLNLFTRVSNLFDQEYETFEGRPMFGRVLMGGISYKF